MSPMQKFRGAGSPDEGVRGYAGSASSNSPPSSKAHVGADALVRPASGTTQRSRLRRQDSDGKTDGSRNLLRTIASDLHFWIPLIVLAGGLLLLDKLR